jgi:formamidopyrimidine-DNA glycosylase
MPELPEVEVTRRSVAPHILGAQVQGLRLGAPLRWPLGVAAPALVGTTVGEVVRRGKYLWLPLLPAAGARQSAQDVIQEGLHAGLQDSTRDGLQVELQGRARADAPGGLLMHLGMSGSLSFSALPGAAGKHDHFDLVTSSGTLRLTDPRRFGAVVWSPAMDAGLAGRLLAGLGREPFDVELDGALLHAALQRRRCSIKAALLAGDVVVGAGNIYACEALFEAGIDPRTRCHRLSRPRCHKLLGALRQVLTRALVLGGATLRDFRDGHGISGAFQDEARVYGRAGLPCQRCTAPVRRIVQAQRATYYCPGCQRR